MECSTFTRGSAACFTYLQPTVSRMARDGPSLPAAAVLPPPPVMVRHRREKQFGASQLHHTGASQAALRAARSSGAVSSSLAGEVNEVCATALRAMLAADAGQVLEVQARLHTLRLHSLQQHNDLEIDRLLRVVEGLLHHTVLHEAAELSGAHAAALDRLLNQVAGSEWKLVNEGQSLDAPAGEEPRFKTWEEVLHEQRQQRLGGGTSTNSGGGSRMPVEAAFYQLLGVDPGTASQADIKAAYRQLALKLHPDVNPDPGASQQFAQVAAAYDVLSDPASRALYDQFGAQGMRSHAGSTGGAGNASRAWEEFKPYKRANKKTKARDASTASYAGPGSSNAGTEGSTGASQSSEGEASTGRDRWALLPQAGAVVEYPLSEVVRRELQDGRTHGVGLLVGRNCDRADARRLPDEVLDLTEVEPLRQEEPGSHRWVPDELSPSVYCRLAELRAIPVDAYDQRWDVWQISAPLSEGCGSPDLGDEVIL